MHYEFKTKGTCSVQINIDASANVIENVEFVKGCPGNTLGIAQLIKGMSLDEVIEKLEGTICGKRETSCPDQLAIALKEMKAHM